MPRFARLTLLLVPVLVGLLAQALPSRAQQGTSVRYAYADTTLLRDTLDLHFYGIFPAADSLGMVPDSLRAHMIRYRMPLQRILFLSDSLHVPVDSVGVTLIHERFNPLGAGNQASATTFHYASTYDLQQHSTTWTNSLDNQARRGRISLTSSTSVAMEQTTSAGLTTLTQDRNSLTTADLRLSQGISAGAQASLYAHNSRDPISIANNAASTLDNYSGTTRMRRTFGGGSVAELTALTGLIDQHDLTQIKQGLSGDVTGHVRVTSGTLFTQDLTAKFTGNTAHTRAPDALTELRTGDRASDIRGTLGVLPNAPVGLNVNYRYNHSIVQTAADSIHILDNLAGNNSADATMRLRADNDHYLNVVGSWGQTVTTTGTRLDKGGRSALRYEFDGIAIDGNYSDTRSQAVYPRRARSYGWIENSVSRSAEWTMVRQLNAQLRGKVDANIGLSKFRYVVTSDSTTAPVPRDAYTQSLILRLDYTISERLRSYVQGETDLTRGINIDPLSTSSNTDTRSYKGQWNWHYMLGSELTIDQTDQIEADYGFYPFALSRNTLGLQYNAITNLQAVFSPRFSLSISHTATDAPRGAYTKLADGTEALRLSDETQVAGLLATFSYKLSQAFQIDASPRYSLNSTSGTDSQTGIASLQRQDKRLDFSGTLSMNKALGSKGQLQGKLIRNFSDSRSVSFTSGLGVPQPRSQSDFWSANVQLTWGL